MRTILLIPLWAKIGAKTLESQAHCSTYQSQLSTSQHDYSVFIRRNSEGITIILLYVDDMPIIYSSLKLVEGTTKALLSFFKIKYLGELQYILGNEFTRSKKGITL